MKRRQSIEDQLKGAIKASGLSLRELDRRSGVPTAILSRFTTGKRTLTLPTADKLCETLGLGLRKVEG